MGEGDKKRGVRESHSSKKYPRQDSNLCSRLRRPMLYPLSYGGMELQRTIPQRLFLEQTTFLIRQGKRILIRTPK